MSFTSLGLFDLCCAEGFVSCVYDHSLVGITFLFALLFLTSLILRQVQYAEMWWQYYTCTGLSTEVGNILTSDNLIKISLILCLKTCPEEIAEHSTEMMYCSRQLKMHITNHITSWYKGYDYWLSFGCVLVFLRNCGEFFAHSNRGSKDRGCRSLYRL